MDASVTELRDAIKQVIKNLINDGIKMTDITRKQIREKISNIIDLEKYDEEVFRNNVQEVYNKLSDFYEQSDNKESPRVQMDELKASSGDLLDAPSSFLVKLKDAISKKGVLKKIIDEMLKDGNISTIRNKSFKSMTKEKLIDAIKSVIKSRLSPSPRSRTPSPHSRSPKAKIEYNCPETITQLRKIAETNGWKIPSQMKLKKDICKFIKDKQASAGRVEVPTEEPRIIIPGVGDVQAPPKSKLDLPVDYEKCESSRNLSKAEIKKYADKYGWKDYPKDSAGKDKWCKWLKEKITEYENLLNIAEDISPEPVIAPPGREDLQPPEDFENCKSSRTLTLAKLKEYANKYAKKYGWNVSDFPKSKATKGDWCDWLKDKIKSHKNILSEIERCNEYEDDWKTEDDIKDDLSCDTGYCNLEEKKCESEEKLQDKPKYQLELSSGKVDVYGEQSFLERLKNKVMSILGPRPVEDTDIASPIQKCGTGEDDLECPEGKICNLDVEECQDEENVGKLVSIQYKGVKLVGEENTLDAFIRKRERAAEPIVNFEDDMKSIISNYVDKKKKVKEPKTPKVPKTPKLEDKVPVEDAEEEKAQYEKLRERLRNIYQNAERPSIKVISGLKDVTNQVSVCVGLSS